MLGVDGVFVHPLGGQGIVHIANGKDASVKANIFTCKLVGVACAVVPLVVLGNIKDRRLLPIGSGVLSAQEIVERIYILTQTRPGELY